MCHPLDRAPDNNARRHMKRCTPLHLACCKLLPARSGRDEHPKQKQSLLATFSTSHASLSMQWCLAEQTHTKSHQNSSAKGSRGEGFAEEDLTQPRLRGETRTPQARRPHPRPRSRRRLALGPSARPAPPRRTRRLRGLLPRRRCAVRRPPPARLSP